MKCRASNVEVQLISMACDVPMPMSANVSRRINMDLNICFMEMSKTMVPTYLFCVLNQCETVKNMISGLLIQKILPWVNL